MIMEYVKRIIGGKDDFSVESVKIPFFRLVFSPFNYILDNGRAFFLAITVYSALLAVVGYAMGTLFLCSFETARENIFCSDSSFNLYLYLFIKGAFLILFSVFYYNYLNEKEFSLKKLFAFKMSDLKLLGMFAVILILCSFPFISFYVLYMREPNPDWVIELLFFAVVSIGFLVPFFMFRFFSVVGLVLEERRIPSIVTIWTRTSENMFKIIFSIFFILAFLLVLILNFYYNFVAYDAKSFVAVLVVEYLYNLISFLSVALFLGHVKAQTFYLFGEVKE